MRPIPIRKGTHWISTAPSDSIYFCGRSFPTKKALISWFEKVEHEKVNGTLAQQKIFAAIIKDIIEFDDSTHFFGSLGAHAYNVEQAVHFGYITEDTQVTPLSTLWYSKGIDKLPDCRWMVWNDKIIPTLPIV